MQSIISSISTLRDLFRVAIAERDKQKLLAIQNDFGEKTIALQLQISNLIERNDSLTVRNRELEAHALDESRYELRKIGAYGDFFAYAYKPSAEIGESAENIPHFVCQQCFDIRKVKSVLRLEVTGVWRCPSCDEIIPTDKADAGLIRNLRMRQGRIK